MRAYKQLAILLAAMMVTTLMLPVLVHARDAKMLLQEETYTPDSEETSESQDTIKVLFIGNSKSYYNNLPEIYSGLVSASQNVTVDISSMLFAGRSILFHAMAVQAVIDSQGDPEKVTETQGKYFQSSTDTEGIPAHTFNKYIYQRYVDVVYPDGPENGIPKFDYIIFQNSGRNAAKEDALSNEKYMNVILDMFRLFSKDTTVITQIAGWFTSLYSDRTIEGCTGETMQSFVDSLNIFESNSFQLNKCIEEASIGASVRLARCGSALIEYLYMYGETAALYNDPLMERLMSWSSNDLLKSDHSHPTPLGTYLIAYSLYVINYQDFDYTNSPALDYDACQTSTAINFQNGKSPGNPALNAHLYPRYLLSVESRLRAAKAAVQANSSFDYGNIESFDMFYVTLGNNAADNSKWLSRAFHLFKDTGATIIIQGESNYELVHRPYIPSGVTLKMNGSTFSYRGYGYAQIAQ